MGLTLEHGAVRYAPAVGRGAMDTMGWLRGESPGEAGLEAQRARGRATLAWGHTAHVLAGCLFCLCLAGPMSAVEVSAGILMGTALCRLHATWRLYPRLFRRPVWVLALSCLAWLSLAISWSPDPARGQDELDSARWAMVALALWPLARERTLLVVCVALGYLAAHGCQLVQGLAFAFGWESLDFDAYPNRISGWLSPASGGSVLVAALGLFLPAALAPAHPWRWANRALALLALAGIAATGARAAWIVAMLVLALALAAALWKSEHRARLTLGAGVTGLVLAGALWLALGPEIRSRYIEGRDEVIAAFENQKYSTSTGARIGMAVWAVRAFEAHPVRGVGTGGYKAWVLAEQEKRGIEAGSQPVHSHAHSSVLHIAASQGLVGLSLTVMLALAMMLEVKPRAGEEGSMQAGLCLGLLAVLLAGLMDAVHVNAQTSAVIWAFYGLAALRPPITESPA